MPRWSVAAAQAAWMQGNMAAAARFHRALRHPGLAQRDILLRYLRKNRTSVYGRRHGFDRIRSAVQYQRHVPLTSYEDYRPYVARIAAGETSILTHEPVRCFALSSGSAGAEKWIPYTNSLLAEFNNAIAPWVANLFSERPALMAGPAYWSVTPVGRRQQSPESRIPIGFDDDSAYVGGELKKTVEKTFAVPESLRRIENMETFRYLTLLHLLRARELRLISVWHPSFLALLLAALPEHWERLVADLEQGTWRPPGETSALWRSLLRPARPRPARAAELKRCGPLGYSSFWPRLSIISCWADAHARQPARELAGLFPNALVQGKGLISTEAFVSLPLLRASERLCPIAIRSHFIELLTDTGEVVLCENADTGGAYTVVVTTGGGLYRYNTHDRVRITHRCFETPCIEFLGKEDQVSDRFGEKLNSRFVSAILEELQTNLPITAKFCMLAPEGDHYTLFIEADRLTGTLAGSLDRLLCRNPHYDYCRRLGQLQSARVVKVKDGSRVYLESCRHRGQRLGNIKPTALHTASDWREVFRVGKPL